MNAMDMLLFLEKRKKELYRNHDSIIKKYDDFLAINGVYRSFDKEAYRKNIKGHYELCDGIIKLYQDARLENEKIVLLEDLLAIGYDKNKLTELVLDVFDAADDSMDLWHYGDLLYTMKKYKYLPRYLKIIENKSYGTGRQMVVLLVGKSKKTEAIPILKTLLEDQDVYGHAVEALTNFAGQDIEEIMYRFLDCKVTWIRKNARRYLAKRGLAK